MPPSDVDVIIAAHDPGRQVERAVRSVLASTCARAILVTHGLGLEAFGLPSAVVADARFTSIEHREGLGSPAGPFNRGLDEAEADYVAVLGSDDWLEPGAVDRWVERACRDDLDAVIAVVRMQGGERMRAPLTRPWRSRRLDVVKDRLFARSAPLGLMRRRTLDRLGLRFAEGLPTGEDVAFSAQLWSSAERLAYARADPCYVVGTDAPQRVTDVLRAPDELLRVVGDMLGREFVAALPASTKRSLAVKVARTHLLSLILDDRRRGSWSAESVRAVSRVVQAVTDFSPGFDAVLCRADATLLGRLADEGITVGRFEAAVAAHQRSGRADRLLTPRLGNAFARDSVLRRYARYPLGL